MSALYIVLFLACASTFYFMKNIKFNVVTTFLTAIMALYAVYFSVAITVFHYRHMHLSSSENMAFVDKAMKFQKVTMEEVHERSFMGLDAKRRLK